MCFRLAGFANAFVFKSIKEKDIADIETYMIENSSPSFKFSPGETKLILALASYVKKVVDEKGDNTGLAHFSKSIDDESHSPTNSQDRADETKTQYFLKKLLTAADRNSRREKGGYRYDNDVKLYAAYIRMIVGPLAYETIQKNLECCLPSLPSTNRYIQSSGCHVTEGILRHEELAIYLKERSLEPVVCLSEDATRISGRIQYDCKTNQLMGFVLPLNRENGLPIPFAYPARSAEEIFNHFSNNDSSASFLNVVMAKPIGNAPAFCLLVYGSDNKYTSADVSKRWEYITMQLAKIEIKVLTISSDSDPKYNAAMRKLSKLGFKTNINWFSCRGNPDGPFYIQDLIHIATKLRNFLLRTLFDKKIIPFGNGFIRIEFLFDLLNMFHKDKHQLTISTLNPKDRQNFQSVLRICDKRVTDLLRDYVQNSESTVIFLKIIRDIIDSFMNLTLTPLQRIRKLWYSVFLIRIWRQFICKSRNYTLKDNFLSSYCYTCVEMNAHSLVLCMLYLKKINKPEFFKPFLFESQQCESLFRQLRSLSTVYSTVTNCTMKEATSRISNIQFQNHIMQSTASEFVYPRLKQMLVEQNNETLPSSDEIRKEIEFCRSLAISTATKIGLIKPNETKQQSYGCKIKPFTSTNAKRVNTKNAHKSCPVLNPITFTASDLKNIQLKNYSIKVNPDDIIPTGPYVKIKSTNERIIVVKKTSLCWLFAKEQKKLSNDRPLRVMTSTASITANRLKKTNLNRPLFRTKKGINTKNKRKTKEI